MNANRKKAEREVTRSSARVAVKSCADSMHRLASHLTEHDMSDAAKIVIAWHRGTCQGIENSLVSHIPLSLLLQFPPEYGQRPMPSELTAEQLADLSRMSRHTMVTAIIPTEHLAALVDGCRRAARLEAALKQLANDHEGDHKDTYFDIARAALEGA